jgi:hypothetical protein
VRAEPTCRREKSPGDSSQPDANLARRRAGIWGDNVADVETLGVVGVRTPQGLTVERWDEGVRLFAQRAETASR